MPDKTVSDILTFTQDMMLLVIEAQWDALAEMQSQQDAMLRKLFSDSSVVFSEHQKGELVEVQHLNKQMSDAAEIHKMDIVNELRSMRQGKAKANAYQSC